MYCTKCGVENPDGNRFCENCGAELAAKKPDKDPNGEKSNGSRRKRIIVIIAVIVAMIAVAVSVLMYMNSRNNAEYNAKIEKADAYMEELDYEKAETAYLEAIELEPKEDEAYIKLADVYIQQDQYDEALAILDKGKKDSGSDNIEEKYNEVYPYKAYYVFLADEDIGDEGIISAVIENTNDDDIPELMTFSAIGSEYDVSYIFSRYICEDEEVTLLDETVYECQNRDYSICDNNVFLKYNDDMWYIGVFENAQTNNGHAQKLSVYIIKNDAIELEEEFELNYHTSATIGFEFLLNENRLNEYSISAIGDSFSNSDFKTYNDEYGKGYDVFINELKRYGLGYMLESPEEGFGREYGYRIAQGFRTFEPYSDNDKSRIDIFGHDSSIEYDETISPSEYISNSFEDYTGLSDRVDKYARIWGL